jgi:hypothetical protein
MAMILLTFQLFLAWLGTPDGTAKTPTPGNISGDRFIPQMLSSFSYVIEMKSWRGESPLKAIKKYYSEKKIPAVIVYAEFRNGVKLADAVINVGQSYSPQWTQEARKLAAGQIALIDPNQPEKGAEGTLIVLQNSGSVMVIAVSIANMTVNAGPVIDHNVYTDLFQGISHMVPR